MKDSNEQKSVLSIIVGILEFVFIFLPVKILQGILKWRDGIRKEKKRKEQARQEAEKREKARYEEEKAMKDAEKRRKEEEKRKEQARQEAEKREKARYEREELLPKLRERAVEHEERILKRFGGDLDRIIKYADYSNEIEWFCIFNLRWKLYVKQFITDEGNIDYDTQYDILCELVNLMDGYHSILMEYYEEKTAIRQEFEVVKKHISPEKRLALKIEVERREEEARKKEKENEIKRLIDLAKESKERGYETKASEYFKQAGDMGDPEGCYQYAWYCDNCGRFTDSKIYLLRAMDIDPNYDNSITRELLANLKRKEAIMENY